MGALHDELNWQIEKKAIQAEKYQMQRPWGGKELGGEMKMKDGQYGDTVVQVQS